MAAELDDGLTEAEWRQVRAVRDEFIAASRCTDPADRSAAEAAIGRIHELAGLAVPRFIWCASPASAHLAMRVLAEDAGAAMPGGPCTGLLLQWEQVENSLRRSLDDATGFRRPAERFSVMRYRPVTADFSGLLDDAIHDLLGPFGTLPGRRYDEVLQGPLGDSVRDSLAGLAWPPPGKRVSSSGPQPAWQSPLATGQHYDKVIEYEVPRRLGIVSYDARDSEWLDQWCVLARSCGWWWSFERACFLTERPVIARATKDRSPSAWRPLVPHCPDGPAIAFRDGWAVHAWHGRHVPAAVVEGSWDIARIFAERNVEVRRCAIEKAGWDEIERQLHRVASAPDPGNPGQVLTLCDLPEGSAIGARVLLCSNGTPEADGTRRRFGLLVPARHTDPVAAAAETYGWSRRQYKSLARRS
jgi:hypothetical protein